MYWYWMVSYNALKEMSLHIMKWWHTCHYSLIQTQKKLVLQRVTQRMLPSVAGTYSRWRWWWCFERSKQTHKCWRDPCLHKWWGSKNACLLIRYLICVYHNSVWLSFLSNIYQSFLMATNHQKSLFMLKMMWSISLREKVKVTMWSLSTA